MSRITGLGLVALCSACSEYEVIKFEGVDVFQQDPPTEVDVLLVVDDSGSMQPYQEDLSQNFDAFLTYFLEGGVDYHIGVITTDIEREDAGEVIGEVVTPDTENAEDVFADIVQVGVEGSASESGLHAAYLALSPPLSVNANAALLRDDAYLSLVFVSDEEDSSPWPVNDYINLFREVKGQRERDVFNASSLVVTDEGACTGEASVETVRYVDVAEQTDGVIGNICSEDFAQVVTELSLTTARLNDTFYLSDLPDASSLRVVIDDGVCVDDECEIDCETGQWTYMLGMDGDVEIPMVVFDRLQLPPPNSQVTVRYNYGGGDPSLFCGGTGEETTTEESESEDTGL